MSRVAGSAGPEGSSWIEHELPRDGMGDRRLVDRLRRLLQQLGGAIGQPLPLACQDWAGTKAAYRFF
ncbi:IS4/Tn5 family transposase DNA-binding protein, partial [Roseomonas chloroacetimidivorans]|uniref:IS4/Tn5 family transposase DNA-binding protein n=1 Tax=Roseomonas chloroacetimidivorans TaxID=1766656 RepID=UPI003C786132